jgi:SAM-dependent methyltransferase
MSFENPTTLEKIAFRIEWSLSGPLIAAYLRRLGVEGDETFLEVGCGGGAVTRKLAHLLPRGQVVGIDPSAYWVAYARRSLRGLPNVTLHVGDVLTENLASEAFDAALFHFVFHEINSGDRPSTLSRVYDLLKEGGRLFLREPTKAGHGISVDETRTLLESVGFREERGEMRRRLMTRTFEGVYRKS